MEAVDVETMSRIGEAWNVVGESHRVWEDDVVCSVNMVELMSFV
jgi:hypothetical protein